MKYLFLDISVVYNTLFISLEIYDFVLQINISNICGILFAQNGLNNLAY